MKETTSTEMLFLKRSEIESSITIKDCIDAVEEAFILYADNKIIAPELMHVDTEDGEFHIKGGGIIKDGSYFALKSNGGYFHNRDRYGIPNIIGLILLCDANNGRTLSVMDSTAITMMRTGSITAVAAKYLANPNPKTVTICGCGTQGKIQLEALMTQFSSIDKVYAWDVNGNSAVSFVEEMSKKYNVSIEAITVIEEGTLNSDIVVTCTPARGFFLKEDYIKEGTFVSAVGADSPMKQELEPSLIANNTLIVDILDQCMEAGELHHVLDEKLMTVDSVYGNLGDVVANKISRKDENEIIIFDTTGSAIQDVAVALKVYIKALETKKGLSFNIYE